MVDVCFSINENDFRNYLRRHGYYSLASDEKYRKLLDKLIPFGALVAATLEDIAKDIWAHTKSSRLAGKSDWSDILCEMMGENVINVFFMKGVNRDD